ncbi:Subtilisin-like protease SBT4.15 [Camellia lanceoleosa]|uniref:Subtilisin-like protease SBT4.15 n=1 Tax=Camellia lanceoleosa TaxID=1840588 RepID=A0ACC0I4G7_9ERIC|nr:Subtilisin-like protease SBT4.15 [Camellia lanceoleosa]
METEIPGVVSVFRNNRRGLHTTHSWDFMGLVGEETMEIPRNAQVLAMLACLRCQSDGRGNANQGNHSMLQIATGK